MFSLTLGANEIEKRDADRKVSFVHDLARLSYSDKLKRGGNCTAITKADLPCPIHGDRLVDGKWLCHIHDPDGTFQRQHRRAFEDHPRTPDVDDQITFQDMMDEQDNATALHRPPDDTQGRIASKRIKKWSAPA